MEEQLKFSLSDISIADMLDNIFKTYAVKKRRKEIVAYYSSKLELGLFGDDDNSISEQDVSKKVDEVLAEDRNSTDPYLIYSKQSYSKAKRKTKPINPIAKPDSNYTGKAGECAVMSELLFRGYNVNSMMVDEGIDLVASKNNVFYYIQVKTKNMSEQNKFYFQIKQDRFDAFVGTQIRYILVARCLMNSEERNIYFTFTNNDIQRFLFKRVIPIPSQDNNNLSIKIEYDTRTGKAYIYDNRERDDVSFNMNNFDL